MIRISLSNLTILDNLEAYSEQSLWVISVTEGYCSANHISVTWKGKSVFQNPWTLPMVEIHYGWLDPRLNTQSGVIWNSSPQTDHLLIIHYKEATTTRFCIFNSSMGTIRHPSHLFSRWHWLNKFLIQILWLPNYFHTTTTKNGSLWLESLWNW